MNIEIKNTDVVYITTSTGKTIYLDDSTDELIIDAWDMEGQPIEPTITFVPDFDLNLEPKPNLTLIEGKEDDPDK